VLFQKSNYKCFYSIAYLLVGTVDYRQREQKSTWNDLLWPSSHLGFSVCLLSLIVSFTISLSLHLLDLLLNFSWIFFNQTFKAGSTQATRLTAARQIGDIAKSHPQDLTSLLKKVLVFLKLYSLFCCNMFSLCHIYELSSLYVNYVKYCGVKTKLVMYSYSFITITLFD